jgi:hypothetical protein
MMSIGAAIRSKQVRDQALGLFEQRQKEMLDIDLAVPVPLHDLVGPHGCVLCALGKTIESHSAFPLY